MLWGMAQAGGMQGAMATVSQGATTMTQAAATAGVVSPAGVIVGVKIAINIAVAAAVVSGGLAGASYGGLGNRDGPKLEPLRRAG